MKNAVFWDIKSSYLTGDTLCLGYRISVVRTDVSEELIVSTIRLTRIGELGY
jgi:hypothetical protein